MNSANDSTSPTPTTSPETGRTSIQAVPPPPEPSALQEARPPDSPPIKSKRKRMTVEGLTRLVSRLDKALVGVVVLLTFLLGSFAARNSDFWQHLASGRAIVQHGSPPRQDPFTYTAEGTWVNNSWLSDLVLYNVFRLTSGPDQFNPDLKVAGPVLIGAKALLIVLLAWIMMKIRRPGQSLWAAAVCTAIAVVVLSRSTFLQPKCISFLLLGLTLYLLQRPEPGPAAKKLSLSRNIIAIPILFAFWVNLDEWFILGPITVGLFLLGELIQQFLSPIRTGEDALPPGHIARRALLLVVGLAACLLNPYFHQAFKVPSDLWPMVTNSPLLSDDDLARYFRQPFSSEVLNSAFSFVNLSSAQIAYYVLAALGLISFILNWADWRGWRTIVWLMFFMLSAYQERMIPFFAVVAGPITALNLQDFSARRYGVGFKIENPWKTVSIAGRLATLLAGIALLTAAWPGMLHANFEEPLATRHVSWQLEVDPSLRQAAVRMRELCLSGVMGDGNGFNFTPEVADYLAWFCPEEKTFFDRRYSLFPKVTESYLDLKTALSPYKERPQSQADLNLKERERARSLADEMSKHHINHLILSGPRFDDISPALIRLWRNPSRWTVLYMDGRSAIFGWTPPGTTSAENRFKTHAFRPAPLAFGPDVPISARAPETAPRLEEIPTEWERLWRGPAGPSLSTNTCSMLFTYSSVLHSQAELYAMANTAVWDILSLAGPVDAACYGPFAASAVVPLRLIRPDRLTGAGFPIRNELIYDRRLEPAATALLAVRAGRRAVKESPQDFRAYLNLAKAIQFLSQVEEGGTLHGIRQFQRVAALHRALALNADSIDVHEELSEAYFRMDLRPFPNPVDLVIEHQNKILEVRTRDGRKGRQTEEEFQKEIEQQKLKIKNMREQFGMDRRQTDYEAEKRRQKSKFRQALAAVQHGLYQDAMKILLDPEDALADRGPEGDRLALQLLISTGQLDEARNSISGLSDQPLDSREANAADLQLEFQIAAGSGDYARADEVLGQLIKRFQENGVRQLTNVALNSTWTRDFGPLGPRGMGPELFTQMIISNAFLLQLADHWSMRGILALEAGDTGKAEEYFERALHLVKPPAFFPQQPITLRYQGLLKSAREQAAKKTP